MFKTLPINCEIKNLYYYDDPYLNPKRNVIIGCVLSDKTGDINTFEIPYWFTCLRRRKNTSRLGDPRSGEFQYLLYTVLFIFYYRHGFSEHQIILHVA